jgi:hypothetical protein
MQRLGAEPFFPNGDEPTDIDGGRDAGKWGRNEKNLK